MLISFRFLPESGHTYMLISFHFLPESDLACIEETLYINCEDQLGIHIVKSDCC